VGLSSILNCAGMIVAECAVFNAQCLGQLRPGQTCAWVTTIVAQLSAVQAGAVDAAELAMYAALMTASNVNMVVRITATCVESSAASG
jgi:hypothetical protein